MRGLGTIVNVAAVIVGGVVGLFVKNGIKPRFQEIIMQALGLATMFLGISGAMPGLLSIAPDGVISTKGTAMLIGSVVGGAFIGELVNLDGVLERFGEWLKKKAVREDADGKDAKFVHGFVTASLVICVGAMAIVGSIEDGLTGNASMLYAKAVLDGVIVMIFASAYGRGAIFSAIPVGILQGTVTLAAGLVAPLFSDAVISSLSFIGSVLIFCVGVNLFFDKKIRVANMLPALVIAGVVSGIWG